MLSCLFWVASIRHDLKLSNFYKQSYIKGYRKWYKIAIWDELDERYILRSFTTVSGYDGKTLPESKMPGIYVDKSTIRADGKFWEELYNEIV